MWRLINPRPVEGERGAVAVMFALLLVGLVGFIALAVDLGATYAKRQELQNGADAAALAAALECATVGCEGAYARAEEYTAANVRQETDTIVVDPLTYPADNVVQVDVSGEQRHWFLPVLPGAPDSSRVSATALATWGAPSSSTLTLPLTFSMCDFEAMHGPSGNIATIWTTKAMEGCNWGVDGLAMPGGFGVIGDGTCEVFVDVEDPWVPVDTGANMPCDLEGMKGSTILLPIFTECRMGKKGDPYCPEPTEEDGIEGGLGSSERVYKIFSFAAFKVLEYNFPGESTAKNCGETHIDEKPITGNNDCIKGQFIEWVLLEDAADYDAGNPDLGASVVTLIDPRDIP